MSEKSEIPGLRKFSQSPDSSYAWHDATCLMQFCPARSSRSELFYKKGVLKIGLRAATLLKKRLWHRCFPVNFAKFLRTPFSEHFWWLVLNFKIWVYKYDLYVISQLLTVNQLLKPQKMGCVEPVALCKNCVCDGWKSCEMEIFLTLSLHSIFT